MALSATSLFAIGILCRIMATVWKRRDSTPENYRERVRNALVTLISDLGWAALAAAIVALLIERAVSLDERQASLADINSFIAAANSYLKWNWAVFLILSLTGLVAFALVRTELAHANVRAVGKAAKWSAVLKGLFALLATSTFIGAEANGTVRAKLNEAKAARAKLTEAQLLLFKHAQVALVREAIASALNQSVSSVPQVRTASTSYAATAQFFSSSLATPVANVDDLAPNFEPGPFVPTADLKPAAIQSRSGEVDAAVASQNDQEKLVNDIVRLAFGRANSEIKARYVDLGNPILNSLLSAFSDPAILDPLREAAAKQANRILRREVDFTAAAAAMRTYGRSLASHFLPAFSRLPAPDPQPGFGVGEWGATRDNLVRVTDAGIRGKSPALQQQARDVVRDEARMEANASLLLFAAKNRAPAEEAMFARYLGSNPSYAALWGYGVIGDPPGRLQAQLKTISVTYNTRKASQIRQAIVQANDGDSEMAATLREMGFDPVADRDLTLPEIKAKLFEVHGPYPIDGFALYFSDVGVINVQTARAYYASDVVGGWVSRICPATAS
jgi:hypothetical protein